MEKCKVENVALSQGLTKLYYLDLNTFISLLKEMIQFANSKSLRKRFMKFETFISKDKKLTNAKFNYFIRLMHRTLTNVELNKRKTLNIKNMDNDDKKYGCPEIYVTFDKSRSRVHRALLDSGAEANIIGLQQLLDLGYDEKHILHTEKLNLRSSSELVTDCILGKIKLKMYVLLQSSQNSQNLEFGYTNLTLLVASKEIKLNKIILGIPHLKATSTKMHFMKSKVKAKSILTTKNGKLASSVLLHNNKEIILKSLTEIKSGDS